MKTPPRVLIVNLAFDIELESPAPKKRRLEDESIGFTGKDLKDTVQPHEDELIVMLEKYMFVSYTKHTQWKISESISFAIDNMYYVNFNIYKNKKVYLGAVKFKTKD